MTEESRPPRSEPQREPNHLQSLRNVSPGPEGEVVILMASNFDILMMHPGLEKMWNKPMSAFLGKKCYREIEKRLDPCPHCPGVIALRTGKVTEAEANAVLDDGTVVPFVLRAYPVRGADGKGAGWVEVVENVASRKQDEENARVQTRLINSLSETSNISRVLTLGLEAALQLQGADSGCAVVVDDEDVPRLVAQCGLSEAETRELVPGVIEARTVVTARGRWLEVSVPVVYRGRSLAALLVRLPGDSPARAGSWTKLEALASILASATARLRADRLRGDSAQNTEAIASASPSPLFYLDDQCRLTAWNKACEEFFGWTAVEVLGHTPPFLGSDERAREFRSAVADAARTGSAGFAFPCAQRDCPPFSLQFKAIPLRDVIQDGTAFAVFVNEPAADETDPLRQLLAEKILQWIERSRVRTFSRSDCYQAMRKTRGIDRPADVVPALELLVSQGRVHERPRERGSRSGRPPTPVYEVTPSADKE